MLQFIYGSAGSGKSTLLVERIVADLKNGKKVLLLVPEQQTVDAEQRMADHTTSISSMNLEVLNFSRLANRVFRQFGGLSYHFINKGACALLMWQILTELSPFLQEYKQITLSDRNFIHLLLDTVKEFKRYNITPSLLERAARSFGDDHAILKRKLQDLSLIYTSYQKLLQVEYDDPTDDLTKLAEVLENHNFFQGYSVYMDSFHGFSPQEYAVIRFIFQQAEQTTIALCCDRVRQDTLFSKVLQTAKNLRRLAQKYSIALGEDVFLEEAKRFVHPELAFLEQHLWATDFALYPSIPEHLHCIECNDLFLEAEMVAKDILRRIREGIRYRDIVLIMRDTSRYTGILDVVLEKYGIPYFLSARTDITTKPLIRFLMALFSIHSGNWRKSDVISYLKTGLTNISMEECDRLETYTMTWNINGRRWTDGMLWNMNPAGYTDFLSDSGKEMLREVNRIRTQITDSLLPFYACFQKGDANVKQVTEALFQFLMDAKIPQKLEQRAAYEHEKGNLSEEKEWIQLWNVLMDVLDQLVFLIPEYTVNASEYMQLLSMILDDTDVGKIPNTIDEVLIGNAALLRVGKAKYSYILGVNDGIFPLALTENALFSDTEKNFLESFSIVLSPDTSAQADEELFYFYQAATCVSEEVTFVYSISDLSGKTLRSSLAIERVKKMFPQLEVQNSQAMLLLDKIEGMEASMEYAATYQNTPLGQALLQIYQQQKRYHPWLDTLQAPYHGTENQLSPSTTKAIFPGNLSLTQSRLERYVLCPFSYYSQYALQLEEKKRAAFKNSDIGTFIHRILERFISKIQTDDGLRTDIPEEEIKAMLDEIISEYLTAVCGSVRNNRMMHLFSRLRRTSLLLIRNLLKEFAQSRFIPKFFEMPIQFGSPEGVIPFAIPLPDGTSAYVYGQVDRVDIYKKEKDVYIRVVDYKTGVKDFSLADVQLGLNLQMLLYLFAIWQNPSPAFQEKVACTDPLGKILPAGVLYFTAHSPEISLDKECPEEEIMEMAEGALSRKGLLLDDEDVLRAMDKNLQGKYIPVKMKKDGAYYANAPVATLAEFGDLLNQITDIVRKIGMRMKSGDATIHPLKVGTRYDACVYCPMKPLCRHSKRGC